MNYRNRRKRLMAWLLSVALLCSLLCGVTPLGASALSLGDLDGNGSLNMRDAMMVYQYAGGKNFLSEEQLAAADADQNGVVNMRDALKLYRVASGEETLDIPEADTLTPITLDEYYGRGLLVEAGETNMVAAYDRIDEAVAAFETTIPLHEYRLTFVEMERVMRYYADDHPEVFWFKTSYSFYYFEDGGVKYAHSVLQDYDYTPDEVAALQEQLRTRTAELVEGLTDKTPELEREKTVHDRLLRGADYDQTYETPHAHDLIGVMLDGTGVCESYARAFQYLMHQCGIPAAVVPGVVNDTESHLWNAVKIDGAWYHVDPTWDDPILSSPLPAYITYGYFNVTTAHMLAERVFMEDMSNFTDEAISYPVPVCTATDAYWIRLAAIDLEAYDATVMGTALAQAIQNGEYVYFRPVGAYTLDQLKADIENGNCFWDMMDVANALLGDQAISTPSYYASEDTTEGIYGLYLFE